jgi:hypothetical protein
MDVVPIKHIVFAQFDPKLGPTMEYSHPPLEAAVFRTLSDFLIPKPELCNHTVVIDVGNKIVGHPCMITSDKYERNALIFNLCLVFESGQNVDPYIAIVEKLARVLRNLELDKGTISGGKDWYKQLDDVYSDLNHFHECQVPIDGEMISLKIFPRYPLPPPVPNHAVPVLVVALQTKRWDLTLISILPFVNGINTVQKISELADVDVNLVKLALQHLIYYGTVKLIDIFQFSNVYCLTKNIGKLLVDDGLKNSCLEFCNIHNRHAYELYSRFRHGQTVNVLTKQMGEVDVRRLVIFGLVHNLLRRVHRYLIPRASLDRGHNTRGVNVWNKSFDELCVELGVSTKTLQGILESGEFGKFDVVWR